MQRRLSELFALAATVTGSHAETARRLGVKPQRVNEWKQGHIPCPLQVQAELCLLAGLSEGEAAQYVWEVLRGRMGKPSGGARGAVALTGSIAVGLALLAASAGDARAAPTMRDYV
jgi:hypothetical protein